MSTIYKVFNASLRDLQTITSDLQTALDCWSAGYADPCHHQWTILVQRGAKSNYLQGKEQIQVYAENLLEEEQSMKFKNRVEHRLYNELQEQEVDGMEVIKPSNYLDQDQGEDDYSEYMKGVLGKPAKADFHGDFGSMDDAAQDAIINPKHYKLIPKEAYEEHPEGLEYMDLMDYMLSHHNGVESHLLGQVFKYACRLGKKDADLQDAKKIEWYASRLVKTIKKRG